LVPSDAIGPVMQLSLGRRGKYRRTEYVSRERALLVFDLPMADILYDFYDILKSMTRGFGSMDYDLKGYQASDLVRLRMKIPRHLFAVALQAAVGGKIIARETIAPMRKDVTSKCYGGDISRKRKLLEKQKEGKKRMKAVGGVEIPQEAFLAVLGEEREEKGKRKG